MSSSLSLSGRGLLFLPCYSLLFLSCDVPFLLFHPISCSLTSHARRTSCSIHAPLAVLVFCFFSFFFVDSSSLSSSLTAFTLLLLEGSPLIHFAPSLVLPSRILNLLPFPFCHSSSFCSSCFVTPCSAVNFLLLSLPFGSSIAVSSSLYGSVGPYFHLHCLCLSFPLCFCFYSTFMCGLNRVRFRLDMVSSISL